MLSQGLENYATVFLLQNDNVKPIKVIYLNYNPYGDIYFIRIKYEDFWSSYVSTNLKPLWSEILEYEDLISIFGVKLLYRGIGYSIIYNDRDLFEYVTKKYLQKTKSTIIPEYYFVTNDKYKYKSIYLVNPINKEEAIKIITDNEHIVLWEAINI
jgi:hypothetical protein